MTSPDENPNLPDSDAPFRSFVLNHFQNVNRLWLRFKPVLHSYSVTRTIAGGLSDTNGDVLNKIQAIKATFSVSSDFPMKDVELFTPLFKRWLVDGFRESGLVDLTEVTYIDLEIISRDKSKDKDAS